MKDSSLGVRWAAIGAAVAVSLGVGGLSFAGAVAPAANPVTNLIAPCRLMDTRAGVTNVGPRNTPLGAGETYGATVRGTNGNCTIPGAASGVVLNVTIVGPTANSYLTVWPADNARPTASNLNWVAGQAPTPNQVSAALSVDGKIDLYNLTGRVDVIVDITGYLTPADLASDPAVIAAGSCKGIPHQGVDWHGCALEHASLHGAYLAGGNLASTDLQNADLTNADLGYTTMTGTFLIGANLSGANLGVANLSGAILNAADLDGANFGQTNLTSIALEGANLSNATFYLAIGMSTANLNSVIWNNTICPDGTNSDSDGFTCAGHL